MKVTVLVPSLVVRADPVQLLSVSTIDVPAMTGLRSTKESLSLLAGSKPVKAISPAVSGVGVS